MYQGTGWVILKQKKRSRKSHAWAPLNINWLILGDQVARKIPEIVWFLGNIFLLANVVKSFHLKKIKNSVNFSRVKQLSSILDYFAKYNYLLALIKYSESLSEFGTEFVINFGDQSGANKGFLIIFFRLHSVIISKHFEVKFVSAFSPLWPTILLNCQKNTEHVAVFHSSWDTFKLQLKFS